MMTPRAVEELKRWGARILFGLLIWALMVMLFSLEGCGFHAQDHASDPRWVAAWDCRCDSCCRILDEIDAESARLDGVEGAQR
ncbi:MAG: hypothetical protein E4G97_04835 [Deltaproteobacteria bacterium]|nr:MAG: hypothetical protein E4G97_04835 [Deltaproteobacteria bacterium]